MASRVCLGVVEAMYGPGAPLYLSFFYPRHKVGLRIGIFLSGAALANAYGGALAYGIAQAKGSIASWKILFIVEGLPTCILAVVAWFFLPDSLTKARFLTPREKEIALLMSEKQSSDETSGLQWKQVFKAFLDFASKSPSIPSADSILMYRLPPSPHVLWLQRLLRLPPPLRPNHHLGNGRLLPRPIQRPQRTPLRALLHRHHRLHIHQRPHPRPRALCHCHRPRRRHRFYTARHEFHRRSTLLRLLPRYANLCLHGIGHHLGGQYAFYRVQASGRVCHAHDGGTVRSDSGHEHFPQG